MVRYDLFFSGFYYPFFQSSKYIPFYLFPISSRTPYVMLVEHMCSLERLPITMKAEKSVKMAVSAVGPKIHRIAYKMP